MKVAAKRPVGPMGSGGAAPASGRGGGQGSMQRNEAPQASQVASNSTRRMVRQVGRGQAQRQRGDLRRGGAGGAFRTAVKSSKLGQTR